MSTFYRPQFAEDWGFLNHKCLPTNLDGLVERHGHFLMLEVKRGEMESEGQRIMLEALAKQPRWTVVIVHARQVEADDKNARAVVPFAYEVVEDNGRFVTMTSPEEFADIYADWFVRKDKNVWLKPKRES